MGAAMPRSGGGKERAGTSSSPRSAGAESAGAGRTSAVAGGRTQDQTNRGDVPRHSRPPDGRPVGTAVPRPADSIPATRGGGTIIVPGAYYGGGYYGAYPWMV